jgi:phage terminase large subunit-like protein
MVADANQDKTSELGWLDELLVDKSPEFQAKVLRWTVRMNIKPKEPLFLTLVAIGQLQALLEDSPKENGTDLREITQLAYV